MTEENKQTKADENQTIMDANPMRTDANQAEIGAKKTTGAKSFLIFLPFLLIAIILGGLIGYGFSAYTYSVRSEEAYRKQAEKIDDAKALESETLKAYQNAATEEEALFKEAASLKLNPDSFFAGDSSVDLYLFDISEVYSSEKIVVLCGETVAKEAEEKMMKALEASFDPCVSVVSADFSEIDESSLGLLSVENKKGARVVMVRIFATDEAIFDSRSGMYYDLVNDAILDCKTEYGADLTVYLMNNDLSGMVPHWKEEEWAEYCADALLLREKKDAAEKALTYEDRLYFAKLSGDYSAFNPQEKLDIRWIIICAAGAFVLAAVTFLISFLFKGMRKSR